MNPADREHLLDVSFRFVSWLRKSHPGVKEHLLDGGIYDSFGARIRQTPTLFWGDVGNQDYATLTASPMGTESILDRVIALIRRSPPAVQNEIIVGFAEGHMFRRPDSPLASRLREALGEDVGLGDVWFGEDDGPAAT